MKGLVIKKIILGKEIGEGGRKDTSAETLLMS